MAPRAAGSPGPADRSIAVAREWARASCKAQGVPVKISDRATLDQVAGLLVQSRELRD